MSWLAFIEALVQAVAGIAKYLGDRQLIEVGKATIISEGLTKTLENVRKANNAAAAVDDPNSSWSERVRNAFERTDE